MSIRHEVAQPCPYCGSLIEASTNSERPWETASARAGDVSLCLRCAGLLVFTGEAMEVRLPTDAELLRLADDPQVQRARSMVFRFLAEEAAR